MTTFTITTSNNAVLDPADDPSQFDDIAVWQFETGQPDLLTAVRVHDKLAQLGLSKDAQGNYAAPIAAFMSFDICYAVQLCTGIKKDNIIIATTEDEVAFAFNQVGGDTLVPLAVRQQYVRLFTEAERAGTAQKKPKVLEPSEATETPLQAISE